MDGCIGENMKKNLISAVAVIMVMISTQSFAASKPSWALFSETAYNLSEGRWNVSLIGWANYGMTDRLQLGTNGILYLFQIPNIYAKYVLAEETDKSPQISVGSSLYYPLVASTPVSTDLSLIFSRSIDNGNYILHGGVKVTSNINDNNVPSSNPINTPGLGYKAGIIINKSELSHFFVEAYSNWIPIGRSFEIGVGGDFVRDNTTLSYGGLFYSADSSDRRANVVPFVNVQWSF